LDIGGIVLKTWKVYAIGITYAVTIFAGAVYVGISYLDAIVNPTPVSANNAPTEYIPIVDANDYTLSNYKFDFYKAQNIDAFKVE
jgi:hypothetical protein